MDTLSYLTSTVRASSKYRDLVRKFTDVLSAVDVAEYISEEPELASHRREDVALAYAVEVLALAFLTFASKFTLDHIRRGVTLAVDVDFRSLSMGGMLVDVPQNVSHSRRHGWILHVDNYSFQMPLDPRELFGRDLWRHLVEVHRLEPLAMKVHCKTCATCGAETSFKSAGICKACTADKHAKKLLETTTKKTCRVLIRPPVKIQAGELFELKADKALLERLGFVF
jgi:hypothetical protein